MDPAAPAWKRHLPLLLLLVITAAAYARLWGVAFSWDDEALIVDNQVTGSLHNIGEFFTRDLWSTTRLSSLRSGYYRPLMLLSLALDRAAFGLSSAEAHFHSLLWHLGAVAALYGLLRRLVSPAGALAGAALFALHPVQSEVLALVAARNDAMAAALLLLSLLLVVDKEAKGALALGGSALALLAGLLSKESAALAPVWLLALDLARWRRPGPLKRYAPLMVAVAAWLLLRAQADLGEGFLPALANWRQVADKALEICGVYGQLIIWPWPLTPARHLHYLPPLHQTLLGLVVFSGLVGFGIQKAKHRGLALVGLIWAVLAFVPSLAATFDKGLLGERYLYLSMAGLGLSLAAILPQPPRWLVPAFALPCVLLLQVRLPQWANSETVWEHAHEVAPSPFTAAGLAWYYHRDKELDKAIPLLKMALEGDPPYLDVCDLIISAMLEDRRTQEAADTARWALTERGCPAGGLMTHHYAVALAGLGRWDEALAVARDRPGGPSGPSLVVVGAATARKGDWAALGRIYQQAGYPDFYKQVIKLLRLGGDTASAARLEAALDQARSQVEAQQQGAAPPEGGP